MFIKFNVNRHGICGREHVYNDKTVCLAPPPPPSCFNIYIDFYYLPISGCRVLKLNAYNGTASLLHSNSQNDYVICTSCYFIRLIISTLIAYLLYF